MAFPLPKTEPHAEETEHIFRAVSGEDGETRVVQLPPTLDNLMDLRVGDQVTQSHEHCLTLVPIFDALWRYLARLAPHLQVFSDLQLNFKRHGFGRDVSPDISVVEGLPESERDAPRRSLDVLDAGARLRLVIEVVSTSTRDLVRKDETLNPALYAQVGVDDLVLVYPPDSPDHRLEVVAKRLGASGDYRLNPPDRRGRILLRSVGLWLTVDAATNQLSLVHRATGRPLLTSREEEERAEQAERRAVEAAARAAEAAERSRSRAAATLILILESRGWSVEDEARRRILACRDEHQLDRWTRDAFTASSVDALLAK